MVRYRDVDVSWHGYATIRIEGDTTVYLDPGRYGVLESTESVRGTSETTSREVLGDYEPRDGDVVCVTHDQHYDSEGVRGVASEDATVLVYESVDAANIDRDVDPVDSLDYDVVRVGERDERTFDDATVQSLPAYNRPEGPRDNHPRGFGVGYLVTTDDVTVFWPGDSDVVDEHDGLDVDVLCPPIGGSFTMDRREAAGLAEQLSPDLVLPVHYDTFDALETDADAFAVDVANRGIPVALDDPGGQ